ncbi:MAG: hypothetical protein P4L39_07315 [Humidesulfovibrio sp.]|nr:hypothetical protein [Humidesulfovibrio sp.]
MVVAAQPLEIFRRAFFYAYFAPQHPRQRGHMQKCRNQAQGLQTRATCPISALSDDIVVGIAPKYAKNNTGSRLVTPEGGLFREYDFTILSFRAHVNFDTGQTKVLETATRELTLKYRS